MRASDPMPLAAPTIVVKTLPVIVKNTSDPATTIIAVLGVVLALASLAWQAWSFQQSGSRVSVSLRAGMQHLDGSAAITTPSPITADQMRMMQSRGYTTPVLAVEVMNSGRSPTTVMSVSVLYKNGAVYTESHFDPVLPFRLDAESEKTWFFERDKIATYAQAMGKVLASGQPMTARGQASIGGKKKPIVSKSSITL